MFRSRRDREVYGSGKFRSADCPHLCELVRYYKLQGFMPKDLLSRPAKSYVSKYDYIIVLPKASWA